MNILHLDLFDRCQIYEAQCEELLRQRDINEKQENDKINKIISEKEDLEKEYNEMSNYYQVS